MSENLGIMIIPPRVVACLVCKPAIWILECCATGIKYILFNPTPPILQTTCEKSARSLIPSAFRNNHSSLGFLLSPSLHFTSKLCRPSPLSLSPISLSHPDNITRDSFAPLYPPILHEGRKWPNFKKEIPIDFFHDIVAFLKLCIICMKCGESALRSFVVICRT